MANVVKMIIQLRRAHTEDWNKHLDVIPAEGEPCYDLDQHTLKIGDGVLSYGQLPIIGGDEKVTLSADGKSLILENGVFKLAGFDATKVGAQPHIGENGTLEWVIPEVDVKELKETVDSLQTSVTTINNTVTNIKNIITPSGDGALPLLDRIESLEERADSVDAKIDEKIKAFEEKINPDTEKIDTLMELIEYINKHDKDAVNLIADVKSLQDLVGNTSVEDQIYAIVNASGHMADERAKAIFEHVKYEVVHKPDGALVDYRDKEIRIMIPADTQFAHQTSGENADKDAYYIGFKAYAPEGAVSFREDNAEIIADEDMCYFEGNEFAGIDEYGRKYSIVWLPVARYENGVWQYYGANSSVQHYIGWYYSVEWYGENGKKIGADCIRINLANEECYTAIEPFYMAKVVKEVAVGDKSLDMVGGKVNIPVGAGLKGSEEIQVAEDGTLSVGVISFSKIAQSETDSVVLDGGGAADR